MSKIIKETVITQGNNAAPDTRVPVRVGATNSQTSEYLVYYIFGALDILLAFRLIFKLAGASTNSDFVRIVYSLSGIFILPFEGIFRRMFAQGVETTSVLEPSTLVAIVVYALLAVGIVKLVRISSGEQQTS